jgi:hypothetical protein
MKPQKARYTRYTRKAAAIPIVMTVITLISLMGMGLLAIGQHVRVRAVRETSVMACKCAADAALRHAKYAINCALATSPWPGVSNVTGAPLPGTNLTYSYTVTGDPATGFEVAGTGTDGFLSRTVHCRYIASHSYLDGIAGIDNYVWLNSKIDMGSIPPGTPFVIRTNSTRTSAIVIFNNTTIPADIIIGPGGDPALVVDVKKSTDLLGDVYASPEQMLYPPAIPPTGGAFLGPPQPKLGEGTISSDGKYAGIDLGNSKTLTVNGDVTLYITGDVKLGNNAQIVVSEGSSLTLYIDGTIDDKNSSRIRSASADPSIAACAIKILGTPSCTSLDIKSSGDIYGAIYAPQADVIVRNSAAIYGAVIGKSFEMKNSGQFWYIAALRDQQIGYLPPMLEEVRWWE